jgi:hypothetical protein
VRLVVLCVLRALSHLVLFVLRGARGLSQRGVCRQRFVLRSQATSCAALPGIQSSAIVSAKGGAACCRLTFRSRRTATPPLNSSVRRQSIFPSQLPPRVRVLASHGQRALCRHGLACVVVFRALGRSSCVARVGVSLIFMPGGARGSPQRGVCRQRFVLRTQATTFAPLPGFQSSAIVRATDGVACCRLTGHSRRTASPPLNSSVSRYGSNYASHTLAHHASGSCCV